MEEAVKQRPTRGAKLGIGLGKLAKIKHMARGNVSPFESPIVH